MTTEETTLLNASDGHPALLGRTYRVNLLNQAIPNELAEVVDYQHGFFYLHFLKRSTAGTTAGWIAASQIMSMYEVSAPPRLEPRHAPEPAPTEEPAS